MTNRKRCWNEPGSRFDRDLNEEDRARYERVRADDEKERDDKE